jgi:hypothetical protein
MTNNIKLLINAIKQYDDSNSEYGVNTELVLNMGLDGRSSLQMALTWLDIHLKDKLQCSWCNNQYDISDFFEHVYYECGLSNKQVINILKSGA